MCGAFHVKLSGMRTNIQFCRTEVFDSGKFRGLVFSGLIILQDSCLQCQDNCEAGSF